MRTLRISLCAALLAALLVQGAAAERIVNIIRYMTGDTPLHNAVMNGNTDIVAILLNSKANANATNGNGQTPLHWAVRGGYPTIAFMLIEAGAKVNIPDIAGNTPLHYAAMFGRREVVFWLVCNGADSCARNKWGKTPLQMAMLYKNPEMAEIKKFLWCPSETPPTMSMAVKTNNNARR